MINGGVDMSEPLTVKSGLTDAQVDWLQENYQEFRELMAYCRCAMMEIQTKFNVLSEELSLEYDRNPIETIKARLKKPESIFDKLRRRNFPLTVESIAENLSDIAGVRVICAFPEDIYMLAMALLRQDDVRLIEKKDYIAHPKENGYRSLHLIVEIPIFLHDEKKPMRVEVQLRTMAMDWWASLEHKLRYKKNLPNTEKLHRELKECAELSATLDTRMDALRQQIEQAEFSIETSNGTK